jgi:lipopolysaccharide transport system ATP-binding protein
MNDVVISVQNMGKQYRLGEAQARPDTLRDLLAEGIKTGFRRRPGGEGNRASIWALKDVTFDLQRGEVLGIIGRNGAGKSTLLKILSRITEPTEGRAILAGRVASLLEVGTGFHQELTGRENIYLNGAILGMGRAEIERKFDEIVEFAEIEKFLDTPVKRYSSGMYVRLAFAVAAHLDPEILLVDEVLAVGDALFQKKCLGKMGEAARSGKTVLFISHNMSAVRQLCTSAIVLERGRLVKRGGVGECIGYYLAGEPGQAGQILDHLTRQDPAVGLTVIRINGSASDRLNLTAQDRCLTVEVDGKLNRSLRIELEVRIMDMFNSVLALYSPGHQRGYTDPLPAGKFCIKRTILLPERINRGEYFLNIALTDPNVYGWVDLHQALRISHEGYSTSTGQAFDYTGGAGWLFLDSG